MSPTVFRYKNYRFFFFSREEARIHIHVVGSNGEAKFWIEPHIELAHNYGFDQGEINDLTGVIKKHTNETRMNKSSANSMKDNIMRVPDDL